MSPPICDIPRSEQFAAQGTTVVIGARDPGRGEAAAAQVRAAGYDVHAVVLDVTDESSAHEAARWVEAHFGRLDVLINNAGISGSGGVSPEHAVDQLPNAADPGFVDADINNHTGYLSPDQGAAALICLATLGPDGPTGGFFHAEQSLPW